MKIKELRQRLNMSQNELAKQLGMPHTTLFNYEAEKCEPNIETLIKLADYFHVTVDELLGRETSLINKMALSERARSIIDKVVNMTDKQQELTEFYIDTMLKNI